MTSSSSDPERFDWSKAEAQLTATSTDGGSGEHDQEQEQEGQQAARVLVDSSEAQRPDRLTLAGLRQAERRPILPAWLRSRRELAEVIRWAVGFAGYMSLYYLARIPAVAGRLASRSPHGLARTVGRWRRWLFDAEGEPLRRVSADRADAETYLKLARQRDRRVRWRAFLTGVLVVAVIAAAVGMALTPPWARLLACTVALGLLGWAGQPADRPLIQRAVAVPKAPG
jgi:S-DNA-T family DNA segregation ATPase FtsK/SpoIIIE